MARKREPASEWARRTALMIAGRIRYARGLRGLTYSTVAMRAGQSVEVVIRWETGGVLLGLDSLSKAAKALDVELAWLLECADLAGLPVGVLTPEDAD